MASNRLTREGFQKCTTYEKNKWVLFSAYNETINSISKDALQEMLKYVLECLENRYLNSSGYEYTEPEDYQGGDAE